MTPRQRQLARHALGLPNARKTSYRNRYVTLYSPVGAYDDWKSMVDAGLADFTGRPGDLLRFWLTRKGAEIALDEGERLCPEDFPEGAE